MADSLAALVRRNAYVDSISLLQITSEVLGRADVLDASLVMATELNRQMLVESGLLVGESATAGPNDLVIAVRAADEASARAAIERAESLLAASRGVDDQAPTRMAPRSLRSAHRADPSANLAVVSVPGPFAAAEARQALAEGLHVFLFSDNVSIEDEVDLKHRAHKQGLLVMGPDCGTAIVRGVGLGFANVVRRGSIGVVGASGTGVQEVASLVHRAGAGISHAIGTGGRDLYAAVGGVTSLQAIDLLGRDPSTETIVLLSKPSDASVARRVLRALASTGKRGVACLLDSSVEMPPGVEAARSLADAARLAVAAGANAITLEPSAVPRVHLDEKQRQAQGLFCGGTLCHEAALVMRKSTAHEFVDFGDDHYTRGRAHPMLDPTLRNQAIVQAGANPGVGVILLDFILGLGAHPDPAGAAVPAIREAASRAASAGRHLVVVAHVVGTERDPQDLVRQEEILRSAGAYLFPSNYEAALAASWLTEGVAA